MPNVASHWIARPWPGYHCRTIGSPGNVTRGSPPVAALEAGGPWAGHHSTLRSSCVNAAGMRAAGSASRLTSPSTTAIAPRSSRLRLAGRCRTTERAFVYVALYAAPWSGVTVPAATAASTVPLTVGPAACADGAQTSDTRRMRGT